MGGKTGVFLITNAVNGKRYVGISHDLETEWFNIKRDIRSGMGIKTMKEDLEKHGEAAFSFEVILVSDQTAQLHRKESEVAYCYDVWHKGYNTKPLLNYSNMSEERLFERKRQLFKLVTTIKDGKYMFVDLMEILAISKNDLEVLLKEITEAEMKKFGRYIRLKNSGGSFQNFYVEVKSLIKVM